MSQMRIWLLLCTGLFGFGPHLLAQTEVGSTTSPKPMYYVPAATTEVYGIDEKDTVNGKIETGNVTITKMIESSGRSAQVSQFPDGSTYTWANDWIAGTFTSWNSNELRARRLHFPMAQVGRNTCWKTDGRNLHQAGVPPSVQCIAYDPKSPPNGPQLYCRMPSDIQAEILPDPHAKDSVTEEFQFSRCSSGWPGPPETYENLRTKEAVFGTIWGCRMSKITLGAKITEEKWIDEHGIMVSDDLDNRLTRRHIIQTLRSLNFEAPDPAQFQPPKDYEVEDLQMEEAPCPAPSNQ